MSRQLTQPVFGLSPSVIHITDGPSVALLLFDSVCPPLLVGGLKLFIFPSKGLSLSSDSSDSRGHMSNLFLLSQSGWITGL